MSELDCKICFYPMDKNKFLPRILNCGHTFCSPCVSELIETSKVCPNCRRPFTSESINEYPVNYIVLEMKYSAKDLEKNKGKYIEICKSKLLAAKGEFEELKPFLAKLKENFENVEKQFNNLIESSDDVGSISIDSVREIENNLEIVRKQLKPEESAELASLTFDLKKCKPEFDVIEEIRKGLSNHKTLAAVSMINGVKKFGKISLKDNFIFIHTFETSHMLDEDEDDLITFSFVDLLNSLYLKVDTKKIYGFLDLTYQTKSTAHRVIIEVLKSSMDLGSSFLKLCTGETDISYKGCSYSQKYKDNKTLGSNSSTFNSHFTSVEVDKIIQIKKFSRDGKSVRENSLYSQYVDSNLAFSGCKFNKYYLSSNYAGSLEIFKLYNNVSSTQVIPDHTQTCSFSNLESYVQYCNTCRTNVTVGKPRSFMKTSGEVTTLGYDVYHVPNVVGEIVDVKGNFEITFKNATFGKVLDSGIAFPL